MASTGALLEPGQVYASWEFVLMALLVIFGTIQFQPIWLWDNCLTLSVGYFLPFKCPDPPACPDGAREQSIASREEVKPTVLKCCNQMKSHNSNGLNAKWQNGLFSLEANIKRYQEPVLLEDGVSVNIKHIVLLLPLAEHSKFTYPVLGRRSQWKPKESTR